ncbi:MAG: hypothetical protein A2068_10890 [Ignavibacteria bacterium GWB2_35_6b]|nr:MAG: hypothetical protein A2068_10890 [Ignavibacteria bacterium GWB2_35_6b]
MPHSFKDIKGIAIGILAGGIVGAIVALLTAPKSGKEVRRDIKNKSEEYYDDLEKYFSKKKKKAGKMIKDGKKNI